MVIPRASSPLQSVGVGVGFERTASRALTRRSAVTEQRSRRRKEKRATNTALDHGLQEAAQQERRLGRATAAKPHPRPDWQRVSGECHHNNVAVLFIIAHQPCVQAEVMQEAAKYIDKLQNNLICHIRTHGYPDKLKSVAGRNAMNHDREGIRRTVESYIVSNNKKWMK